MNYETVIEEIEGNSRFNVTVFVLLGIMAFTYAVELNSLVFLNYTPSFRCADNVTGARNITWLKDQCHGSMHLADGSTVAFSCTKWTFDPSVMRRTVVTDLGLVCHRSYFVTALETILFTGLAIGAFNGAVGDVLGRKKSILLGVTIDCTASLILPFVTNIWVLLILRFIYGLGVFRIFQGVCYITEITTMKRRSLYLNNFWFLFVLGYILTPIIAYGTRDWRMLRLITNVPMLAFVLYLWIPDSPRWLSVVGRHKEASQSLVKIAGFNGLKYSPSRFDALKVETEPHATLMEILGTGEMRKKILVLVLANGAISLCYNGLSTNAHFVSTNIFINVFLQGVLEIATGPLGWISSSLLNRRVSMTTFFVITGVCLLVSGLLPLHNMPLTVSKAIFAMTGKFFLATGYCIMDMYLTEIFPTSVRGSATFIILGTAATFTVLAPSINRLDSVASFLSSSIYAALISSSAILIFALLPETKGCPLPQTIFESNQLKRGNEKMFRQLMLDKDIGTNVDSSL